MVGLSIHRVALPTHVIVILTFSEHLSTMTSFFDSINTFIYELNKATGVHTPFLHKTIMQKRGSRKGAKQGRRGKYYIHQYHRLYDGCHASYELADVWSESLKVAMSKNEELEDSDYEEMPKRANGWRD